MSPSQKKARISPDNGRHAAVSTTQSGQTLFDLLDWLKENGCRGLEDGRFDFLGSDGQCGGSLGGFAAKDFDVGEVLFAIPLTCILSLSNASNTSITSLVRDAAKAFDDSSVVTSEEQRKSSVREKYGLAKPEQGLRGKREKRKTGCC